MTDAAPLPPGITATTLTQYRVGDFTYTDLDHALAEHRRVEARRAAGALSDG